MSINFPLFITFFTRFSGCFLLSPFFQWMPLPFYAKIALTFAVTLILAPFFLSDHQPLVFNTLFFLNLIKELAVGYLIGFVFAISFEAAAFAGEVVGTLLGFSQTELFNPESTSTNPLFSRFFTLFVITLFFALDFHHMVLKTLFDSFSLVDISAFSFKKETVEHLILASTRLFTHMLDYATYPLFILFLLSTLLAIIVRVLPTFHFFSIGLPLQVAVGFVVLAFSFSSFPEIFKNSFNEMRTFVYSMFH